VNGSIAIDFRPGSRTVPQILRIVDSEGFALCGLHLVPSCAERATLMLDCGYLSRAQLVALETKLSGIDDVLAVIHVAQAQSAARAAA
jgi:hypothetical protein